MTLDARANKLTPEGFGPDAEAGPLDEPFLRYLFRKTHESPAWDFKSDLSIAKGGDFAKTAKDIFAFGNFGGGHILIGWNTTTFSTSTPITVGFAQRVGDVLSELGEGGRIQDHYKFYM